MKVGFIGLGKMGAGICSNIVKNGIDVVVYDINPANVQKFVDMGASSAATVKELAAQVDVCITCVPMPKDAKGVLLGPDGVFENLPEGGVHFDLSTLDIETVVMLEAEAAKLGGDFLPLCFDVAKRDVVVEMFANLPEGFKDIDVLLNNAGSSIGQNPAQAGNMDDWDEMIATNINGLLYCTRCVLPGMIERGSGHIVNIGSVAGNRAFKCGNVYGATKAFVNHFSRMLRCDLLGTPVRVTNIKPGHLHTEFLAVRFKGDLKTSEAAYENLDPLTPENIAESVWWSVNLPAHMDVCDMELMPMCQSDGGWSFCHKS